MYIVRCPFRSEPAVVEAFMSEENVDYIVLGGGCFWCLEAVYKRMDGIVSLVSGYAGGTADNPSYEQVCTGKTGHAEVVRLGFDPARISLRQIFDTFWKVHDPTTLNRQGADVGTQYRSAIFYTDEAQRQLAAETMQAIGKELRDPVVTQLEPLTRFWPAEDYHQDYYDKHPFAGYCQAVIRPKLSKLALDQSSQT
jgi:peptide-methionine (S)-S-oxide reductase